MSDGEPPRGLGSVHGLKSSDEARAFYDAWAEGYEDELAQAGYAAPQRCAAALARFAADRTAPVAEFGCGTGLGGLALRAAGFDCIDGFDLSEAMRARAADKHVYRHLAPIDLAQQPLAIEPGLYANAAAIGVVNPAHMPATVIDAMLAILPPGGCLVFSLNEHAAADGSVRGRVCELTDTGAADLLLAEDGEHLPGSRLAATVYVLRRR